MTKPEPKAVLESMVDGFWHYFKQAAHRMGQEPKRPILIASVSEIVSNACENYVSQLEELRGRMFSQQAEIYLGQLISYLRTIAIIKEDLAIMPQIIDETYQVYSKLISYASLKNPE